MRAGMSGVERQRLSEIGGSLFIAADLQQGAAALVPRFGVARGLMCNAAVKFSIASSVRSRPINTRPRLLRDSLIRRDRQGPVVARKRFGQAIETLHRGAAIVEGLEVVWAQCQCAIEAHQRLIVSTKQTQRRSRG